MKIKIIVCLAILMVITSCTSVIQVSVPTGSQLIVVDAFLDNSSNPQTVRLTFNANYFSNVSTPPVLGATVSLNDLTNAKTYSFTPDGYGNYVYTPSINDSMAQLHHKYQLNISYNGNMYNAVSIVNRTMAVDNITFRISPQDYIGNYPLSDTTKPRKYYPYVHAKDSTGVIRDFYWLKVFKNDMIYNQPAQLDIIQDGGYAGDNGDSLITPFAFQNLTNDNNPLLRNDVCMVEIYSIDNNTFEFLTQLKAQMTNAQSGLFAVTPQNVKTNIQQTNGAQQAIGWFNMGLVSSKSVIAK